MEFESFRFRAAIIDADDSDWASRLLALDNGGSDGASRRMGLGRSDLSSLESVGVNDRSTLSERARPDVSSLRSVDEDDITERSNPSERGWASLGNVDEDGVKDRSTLSEMGKSDISSLGSVDENRVTEKSGSLERDGADFNSPAYGDEGNLTDSARTAPPSSTISARPLMRLRRAASLPVATNDICEGRSWGERDDINQVPVPADDADGGLPSVRPSSATRNAGSYTIIAFVNSASGGQMGKTIENALQSHLGPIHVIDLKSCRPGNMPEDTLIKYAKDPAVRVLACGGDGTCGWIFSSLDKVWAAVLGQTSTKCSVHLSPYKDHLPLAIMPLGTGNDLSRQYGWGPSFQSHMKDKRIITAVQNSQLAGLDRWRCIIMPLKALDDEEKQLIPKILGENTQTDRDSMTVRGLHSLLNDGDPPNMTKSRTKSKKERVPVSEPSNQFFDGVFCNYFSLGFDAKVVYLFHHEREMHPEKFSSPLKNKMVYIQKAPYALKSPKLRKRAKVLVNNENGELVSLEIPNSCRGFILMNIQSYAGGRRLTSASKGDSTDGKIEVIFVSNAFRLGSCMAMGPVAPFLRLQVAAQTNNVIIRTRCPMHCQVDGEPWLQEECVMQVKFHSRNPILKKIKLSCACLGGSDEADIN